MKQPSRLAAVKSVVVGLLYTAGVATVLVVPLVALNYGLKYYRETHDMHDSHLVAMAKAYGRNARADGRLHTLSGQPDAGDYSMPPAAHPSRLSAGTPAEDVKVGCWQVQLQDADQVELSAQWLPVCPPAAKPTTESSEGVLPTEPFYLSGWAPGTPLMAQARSAVVLSEAFAGVEDVAAGMLYLPATEDGRGYYVAAWVQVGDAGEQLSGLKVGRYGAPPPSINTKGGRVYLDSPWSAAEPG